MARLPIDGYGQIEINNCAFRRDGRIEAQCAPNATDFKGVVLENGMIYAVDTVNKEVKLAVDESLPLAINYSAEHARDERKTGLKDFAINPENDALPRLGYLSVGDKFTTNTLTGTTWDDVKDLDTVPMYGQVAADGSIELTTTFPTTKIALKAVKKTTMPDGQPAVQFQVLAVYPVVVAKEGE